MPTPDWSRFGRSTAVPILLLVGLLVILGHLHIDLAHGYTAPRVVADDRTALVFYDEGGREATFSFRQSDDGGKSWAKRRQVPGVLLGAALTKDRLVALLQSGDEEADRAGPFYSVYPRTTFERTWSGDLADPELGLTNPRQLVALGEAVYVFGTDKEGALRVARLSDDGHTVVPVAATLPKAAVVPDPAPDSTGRVPPPVAFSAAIDGDGATARVVLVWRVVRDPAAPRVGGDVRWSTFDGKAFSPFASLTEDLLALAAATLPGPAPARAPRVHLFAQRASSAEEEAPSITVLQFGPAGFEPAESIPYEREGLARAAGVAALAAGVTKDRTLLVAQIGSAIRLRSRDGAAPWGPWEDVARLPLEQRAVVWGWVLSMLALSGALVVQGWRAFRAGRAARAARAPRDLAALCEQALAERRAEREATAPAAATPAPAAEAPVGDAAAEADADAQEKLPEAAPLHERALAFLVDLGLILALTSFVASFAPRELLERLDDPRVRLAIAACFVALVLVYFVVFEALFARTPGKRLMNLEVQALEGGRPSVGALVFRNLFRIELLVPPPYLTLFLSVVVMLVSPQHQRPGDLVARTAVRRSRPVTS